MKKQEKAYKEERFDYVLYVNDNIICKRNFKIFNYIENSMNTLEFKETVDEIVGMIEEDLKSKSRVYTWYHFNPEFPNENEELMSPTIEPWSCTFKIVILDNKREVFTKIWDGYGYPRFIRERVDLSNKYVKVTDKNGKTYTYDKETFFKNNEGRLSFDHEVLKSMISDKGDVLTQITKKICEACSASKEEVQEADNGKFDFKDTAKYLSKYTVLDDYKNENGSDGKRYAYSLYLTNKKTEKDWERAVQKKTNKYFKGLL